MTRSYWALFSFLAKSGSPLRGPSFISLVPSVLFHNTLLNCGEQCSIQGTHRPDLCQEARSLRSDCEQWALWGPGWQAQVCGSCGLGASAGWVRAGVPGVAGGPGAPREPAHRGAGLQAVGTSERPAWLWLPRWCGDPGPSRGSFDSRFFDTLRVACRLSPPRSLVWHPRVLECVRVLGKGLLGGLSSPPGALSRAEGFGARASVGAAAPGF